jgi:hypothetical protein
MLLKIFDRSTQTATKIALTETCGFILIHVFQSPLSLSGRQKVTSPTSGRHNFVETTSLIIGEKEFIFFTSTFLKCQLPCLIPPPCLNGSVDCCLKSMQQSPQCHPPLCVSLGRKSQSGISGHHTRTTLYAVSSSCVLFSS